MNHLPISRRHFSLAGLSAAGCLLPGYAFAQERWPARPVRVVIGFTAGTTADILTRPLAMMLGEKLGQPFVIDFKPGSGGNIGTADVVRSAANGYTLIVNSVGPMSINKTLYKNLPYDPLTDLAPIVQIADVPNLLVCNPSLPTASFDDFINHLKKNPGKLSYGSTGVGTSAHLSTFLLCQRAGADALHVPYKGADGINDLLAGRVDFAFATIPSVMSHVKAGKLRSLAVSSVKRSTALPDIPTVAEKGFPGFSAGSWFGLFAPKNTPASIITMLNQAVNSLLPDVKDQMIRAGAEPVGGTPEELGALARSEYEKWKAVVIASGATVQ